MTLDGHSPRPPARHVQDRIDQRWGVDRGRTERHAQQGGSHALCHQLLRPRLPAACRRSDTNGLEDLNRKLGIPRLGALPSGGSGNPLNTIYGRWRTAPSLPGVRQTILWYPVQTKSWSCIELRTNGLGFRYRTRTESSQKKTAKAPHYRTRSWPFGLKELRLTSRRSDWLECRECKSSLPPGNQDLIKSG